MPAAPGDPSAPREPPRTRASALWFWTKVVLCLVALDAVLFGTGLFWDIPISWRGAGADNWLQAYRIVRQIETRPVDEPLAVALGSSVVRMTLRAGAVERRMATRGAAGAFANLAMDGSTTSDAALVAGASRRLDPWLVIYGAEARDFYPEKLLMVSDTLFRDSETQGALSGHPSLDEQISLFVKTHWQLYRYRPLARIILRQEARRIVGLSADIAYAAPAPPEGMDAASDRPRAKRAMSRAEEKALRDELWQRWRETRDFADYEAYLAVSQTDITLAKYRQRRRTPNDLDTNPQVDALRWMLRQYESRGTRVVVAYFPENPVFRDPKADAYFDPAVSDGTAAMLARESERFGARFVDLRSLLPAEDFGDMIHVHDEGRGKLIEKIAQLIAEEWHARAETVAEPTRR